MFAILMAVFLLTCLALILWFAWRSPSDNLPYAYVSTVAGLNGEFGEPFGIAVKDKDIYVSDGQNGKVWRVGGNVTTVFAEGLDTPSAIAFDTVGNVIVADSGSHTIKSISPDGVIKTLAGVQNRSGFADGDAAVALFNAPIGLAVVKDGKIIVADTYNDRIRVIENGSVSTLAGSVRGYADGLGVDTKFDTPSSVAVWHGKLLVSDTGNRRIRVIEPDGRVWTLAGSGSGGMTDGSLYSASFVQPTAVTTDNNGTIYVTDGNTIRRIGGGAFPLVSTISSEHRGLIDGPKFKARFNRPSGLLVDSSGDLIVADSENRLVRRFSSDSSGDKITAVEVENLRDKPEEFRVAQPARWPFDPRDAKRDIAGTLGEIRGEVVVGSDQVWFHNGLDIAGAYGETARFIRDEKVLRPIAAENFGTLRELLRMPTLGYIHIRLGRKVSSEPFADERFLFERDATGKLAGIRVPRGTKFNAGEPIGTLNAMNHVHLVAGRSGSEMNAIDALTLPGLTDSRPPVIEKVTITDENWREIETSQQKLRIKLEDKPRIVVRAYDQIDGNSERRRLGVYRMGYEILNADGSPRTALKWTISFNRLPPTEAVKLVYAEGSHSGATGETIFNYIATNYVNGDEFREGFIDTTSLGLGDFAIKVFAADYFGNVTSKEVNISIVP